MPDVSPPGASSSSNASTGNASAGKSPTGDTVSGDVGAHGGVSSMKTGSVETGSVETDSVETGSSDLVRCTLLPTPSEAAAIEATATAFAAACEDAISIGLETGSTSNAVIHRRCYYDLRRRHHLSANLAIRAIARAARALKETEADRSLSVAGGGKRSEMARTLAAPIRGDIEYDRRVFRLCLSTWSVSLSTVDGRLSGIGLETAAAGRALLRRGRIRHVLLRLTDTPGANRASPNRVSPNRASSTLVSRAVVAPDPSISGSAAESLAAFITLG
jgi:hypothetical protein